MDLPAQDLVQITGLKAIKEQFNNEREEKLAMIIKLQDEVKLLDNKIGIIDTAIREKEEKIRDRRNSSSTDEIGPTPRQSFESEIGPSLEKISIPATPENLVHQQFKATQEENNDCDIRHAFERAEAPEEIITDLIWQYKRIENAVTNFYALNNVEYFMPLLEMEFYNGSVKLIFRCPNVACCSQKKKMTLNIETKENKIKPKIDTLRKHAKKFDKEIWEKAVSCGMQNILSFNQRK